MNQVATRDIYTIVTNTIIQHLEQGTVPWKQPWRNPGLPRNLVTQRPYRGINHLLLKTMNHLENEFATFRQVQDLGGSIKKGEKGTLIVYWLWHEDLPPSRKLDVRAKSVPTLRYYFVWNVSQCTGLPDRCTPLAFKASEPFETCNRIIAEMLNPPKIVHNEPEAYYHIPADIINLPRKELFASHEGYYLTLLHEAIHSTGAAHRLNRKELVEQAAFASDSYSIEELTAELGACYLAAHAGFSAQSFTNNAAYIKHWLGKLKEDNRLIVYAAARAQRAVNYILNIKDEENALVENLNSNEL